jgi:SNF2 family DNA or RNA helicase/intein/homing endonuclease
VSPRESGAIALWGERAQEQTRDSLTPAILTGGEAGRAHPFALRDADLQSALTRLWKLARPWVRPRANSTPTRLSLWLPTADDAPYPSAELVAAGGAERPEGEIAETRLLQWSAPARLLDAEAAGSLLAGLPFTSDAEIASAPRLVFGGDLRFWSAAAALAQEMLVRQWYVPGVVELPRSAQLGYGSSLRRAGPPQPSVGACWYAALAERGVAPRFEALVEAMPDLARAAVTQHRARATPSAAPPAQAALEGFLHAVVNARVTHWLARSGVRIRMSPTSTGNRPTGLPYQTTLTRSWLESLSRPAEPMYLPPGGARTLLDDLMEWNGAIRRADRPALRLCFRLAPPAAPETPSGEDREQPARDTRATASDARLWRLDYLAQALDDLSLITPLGGVWRGTTALLPAHSLGRAREEMLRGLGRAASLFAPIARSLRESRPETCYLTAAEAYEFLRDAAPQLEKAGFVVQTPPWWKRGPARAAVRGKLRGGEKSSAGLLGLDALVSFDYTVSLGGEEITREELERLAALKEPLVRLRGQWVEIQPEQTQAALTLLERAPERLTLGEALHTATTGALSAQDGATFELEEVNADGWIGDLLGRLRGVSTIEEVDQPEDFCGELRPYQLRGVSWLNFLTQYGLGACLADDMGLGKCLVAGSQVSTTQGPRLIESLWEQKLLGAVPDGDGGEWGELVEPIVAHTFDGRKIVNIPIHRIYRQSINEPCIKIVLGDGSHLTSTRRHCYLTPAGWKMAGELRREDLVAVPASTLHVGNTSMPTEIAELMAWQLAGGAEAELFHQGRIVNSDLGALGRVAHLAEQMGVELPPIRRSATSYYLTTSRLYHLFEPWSYNWGRKSAGKHVPHSILEAPIESQRTFIQALFDAKGQVRTTHCELTMASEQVIYALKTMLRNFGVWTRVRQVRKWASDGVRIKRPYFTLTFGGDSVQRFAEQFKLRILYKQAALERLAALPHNTNVEGVPTHPVVATMRERGIPLRSVGLGTAYEWQGMSRSLATSVSLRLRAKGYVDLSQRIDELAAPGIYWCKVKDVTEVPYRGYVYDIEVPGTHNYIANGVITHNTAQLLALALRLKAKGTLTRPILLICPTSIVGNWQHEAGRFAPDLRVLIHHGAERLGRADAAQFLAEIELHDLVITTYSLAPRDEATLAKARWGAIVLDEAQNIKNVAAKQSRVVRRLSAPIRIALTGTPVENRLVEFWSIMDFLNPGYLGPYKRFQQRYANRIERRQDKAALTQVQALTRPFILRRLKSDPTIIQDLPEKIEMREYCSLTREQVSLYEAVVREGLRQLEENPPAMRRRGVILAMLTRLKQVCNHPAHMLDDGSPLAGRSGKLTRLEELVDELLADGDRALIFTQFAALGARLQPYLAERFGVETLYLHGGVPRLDRTRMVERFQAEDGPPLFMLSLKAGGYGLNLTRANHVIHFDRWWNPAVENQATDRAFRIGQTRNVQVRTFVCSGTLEERIDLMIEQKRALAEKVVGTGENWITELSTEQLRDLFSLRADALAE